MEFRIQNPESRIKDKKFREFPNCSACIFSSEFTILDSGSWILDSL
jgi:hypothetical protein